MKLGTNIIGGCCQVGPEIINRICKTMMVEMYDAVQTRILEEERDSNPDEEWPAVLKRLEKPSEDDRKKAKTEDDERYPYRKNLQFCYKLLFLILGNSIVSMS